MSEGVAIRLGVVTAAAALAVLAGCAGGARHTAPPRPPAKHCATGSERRVGSERLAWAAVARRPTVAFRAPGRERIGRFGLVNVNRYPTVFGVLEERLDTSCRATWLRVALPMRPNGITGWVR